MISFVQEGWVDPRTGQPHSQQQLSSATNKSSTNSAACALKSGLFWSAVLAGGSPPSAFRDSSHSCPVNTLAPATACSREIAKAHTSRARYTKYELAYPCGNDANTERCCPYNSILSLEKKIVWSQQLVPQWYKRWAPGEIRIRKIIFCVGVEMY